VLSLQRVNDEVIHAKGYGMANNTAKNNINTKLHVASITKQFTAAAIMQLVEQNKINLKESINEFLPSQYRSDKWEVVNIHHLLSHTSGIEDYAVTRDYYNVEKGFCLGNTVDGMIKEAMSKELEFSPGSQVYLFQYRIYTTWRNHSKYNRRTLSPLFKRKCP
jgi:D-alanyl-D-alanine carboxypeptidase